MSEELSNVPADFRELAKDIGKANKKKEKEQLEEVVRIIDNIDEDFKLSSWGYTSRLKITQGKKKEYIQLRIKSVGVADVIEETSKGMPRPPIQNIYYKKGTPEAQGFNSKIDVLVKVIDEGNEDYQRMMEEHNRKSGQIIVLSGLAYDLTWDGAVVLEGTNTEKPNHIVDQEKAILALRRIGISGSHYSQILRDIRGLTEDIEEQEAGE